MLSFAGSPLGRGAAAVLIGYFRARLENPTNVPRGGGALLVSNHSTFGLDSFVLTSLIWTECSRYPRFLVERNLAKLRGFRAFFEGVAALPGTRDVAVAALASGELVGVYPGGINDSLKLRTSKNRLLWETRSGFVQVAMRARVPIIPIAGVGIDDMYHVVYREPWIGRRLFGSERYDLPLALGRWGTPLPRRVPLRFVVLPAVGTGGNPDDPEAVESIRALTHQAISAELTRESHGQSGGDQAPPATKSRCRR